MQSSSSTLQSKTTWMVFGALFLLVGLPLALLLNDLSHDLPDPSQLESYKPKLGSEVYSSDGKLIKEFFEERRAFMPLSQIPAHLKQALLATEDRNFYNHWGVNTLRLAQALAIDLVYMEKRQGASTIAQQLARLLYLTPEKTITRKIKEIMTAIQIERTYTKDEILEMYLNHVYLGHGAYGVQMAAQRYFGKNVQDLELQEAATLVALVQRPEPLSPIRNPAGCQARRNLVLRNMYNTGLLAAAELQRLTDMPLGVHATLANEYYGTARYFTEHVRQLLWQKYGRDLLTEGFKIYTTLDTRLQYLAENIIQRHLREVQSQVNKNLIRKREHLKLITPAMLDSLGLTLQQFVADSTLLNNFLSSQRPVQVAFICIETKTGYVRAMIGGRDFDESKYNRVIQAQRQPGSAFKPFVYATVIDNGYQPTFEVLNQPVVVKQVDGTEWRPQNFDGSIGGFVTLREALARSLNLPTVRLVQQIANPATVVKYAQKMGLTTNIPPYESIALGAGEVIPIEITSAYSAFPNQGVRMEPIFITRVEDKDGNLIEENRPHGSEVLSKETATIMTDMMRGVLDFHAGPGRFGTGVGARSKYGFTRPAGGKSGTTNEYRDTWFIGFTPQLTTGVWVGFDRQDMSFERGTGSSICLPVWAPFMKAAHDTLGLPVEDFNQPPTVYKLEICTISKELANEECPSTTYAIFRAGTEPKTRCHIHHGREKSQQRRRSAHRT